VGDEEDDGEEGKPVWLREISIAEDALVKGSVFEGFGQSLNVSSRHKLGSKAELFLDIHSRLLIMIKDFDSRAVAYVKDIERVKRNSSAGVLTSGLTVATLLEIIPARDKG
jgi:hypothetical protein